MKPSIFKVMAVGVYATACVIVSQQARAHYETCYKQEYKCDTHYEQQCHSEQQCDWVPGHQQCHQEQVCHSTPSSSEECREQNVCHINPDGTHECHSEQVCRPGNPGGQDCHYEQRCEQGSSEQQCHTVPQCQQVPQQDCHYENVPSQCWVDDPPPQPPYHPPTPPPQPPYNPPAPPDDPPYVPPYNPPDDPPYNPPAPPVDPGNPDVPEEMGEATVTGLRLKIFEDLTAAVVFKDVGQSEDYLTDYAIVVLNEAGKKVIQQKISSNGKEDQKLILADTLTLDQWYTLKLKVTRKGGSLDQTYSFVKKFVRPGPPKK